MATKEKMLLDVKWATRQRLQYIEVLAYYAGVVSRGDVARAFGLSDPAATKDLKLYNDLAPGNLSYNHAVFGFVPEAQFSPVFANLEPGVALPMMAANLAVASGPYQQTLIYGLPTANLPMPVRLPSRQLLAQITRAIRGQKKLKVRYRSLSSSGQPAEPSLGQTLGQIAERILEPHTLVDNGLRWHVRAYNEERCDFRDFVLSRFEEAECLDEAAESSAQYDEDWVETLVLKLGAHQGLEQTKRESLMLDYATSDGSIELEVRRALIGYVLQRLNVDTTVDHSQNPQAFQLMLLNRDEVEAFAAWALD
jgi:hypothetical protein